MVRAKEREKLSSEHCFSSHSQELELVTGTSA